MAIRKLELLCAFLKLIWISWMHVLYNDFVFSNQNLMLFQNMTIGGKRKGMFIVMYFRSLWRDLCAILILPKNLYVLYFLVFMEIINLISILVFSIFKVYFQIWLCLYFRWSFCLFCNNIYIIMCTGNYIGIIT